MTDPIPRLNAALEGRYRTLRELGAGGMATVYLADDLRHERKVAIKVLKPELAAVIGAERFLAEIRTTANLQHPHILPLHDSGEADGFLYYVMPYVEGESLRERLDRERQLPVAEAVAIATKVASALQAAHDQGVIHRDIKPANLLLSKGEPLVADFGIGLAVSAAGGDRLTQTGLSLGTPGYMSPEQAGAEPSLDGRTDIYSLAATLYEMLAGRPPFVAPTTPALMLKVLTEEPAPVSTLRSSVPANVDAAVMTALAKLPADRFRTAREFAGALAGSGSPHPVTAWSALARQKTRRRAGILALLVGMGLAFVLGRATRPGPGDPQRVVFDIELEASQGLPVMSGLPRTVAISPAGDRVVYVGRQGGVDQLYSRLLADPGAEPVRIPGTEGALGPFFSHDGQWVGFFAGGTLRKISLSGGSPIRVAEALNYLGGAWAEDNTILYTAWSSPVMAVSADGGTPRPVTELDSSVGERGHRAPYPLPGGTRFLFEAEGRIYLQDRASGERTFVVEGGDPFLTDDDLLLFARETTLLAAPLHSGTLELGQIIEITREARHHQNTTHFAASRSGTVTYAVTPTVGGGRPGWVDLNGNFTALLDEPAVLGHPRVTPDGRRITFHRRGPMSSEIVVYDVVRGISEVVGSGARPVWEPDGENVTFQAGGDLYSVPAAGGSSRLILDEPAYPNLFPLGWWAEGRVLVYSAPQRATSRNVWTMGPEGDRRPFLETTLDERSATLSPDGRWMAYSVIETGRPERVYIRRFPTGDDLQIVSEAGVEPVWSRSGLELFYRSLDGRQLWSVAIDPATGLSGQARLLFEGPYKTSESGFWSEFDATADGRLLMILLEESTSGERIRVDTDPLGGEPP